MSAKSLKQAPSSWQDDRLADSYLTELLGLSLDRLRKEPELLKSERQQVERSIQSVAVSSYDAFITTARCLDTIDTELTNVCSHLDKLLEDAPALAAACEQFSVDAAKVMEQHSQNKQLGSCHPVLLELLEVPSLMDTCVRSSVYDEALDLAAFVTRLGLLHPDVPLVKMLLKQVSEVSNSMLTQLLSRLKTNIQLPECLRIMGYLRRIAAFSESELRLQFLQCRDEWISSLVAELDDSDSYEFCKHLTDVYRLHLFDAVMQYRAIFFDALPTNQDGSTPSSGNVRDIRESGMLYSWAAHRISTYLAVLEQHLPRITEGSNLAAVLEYCMYCGSSLSRVGLDFQTLLQPAFQTCVLSLFTSQLTTALHAFNTRLETHKWVPLPSPMLARQRSHASANSTGQAGGEGEVGKEGEGAEGDELAPPYVVMEHLPLAVFTNAVLSALNELRHVAMLGLVGPLAGCLQRTLEHVAASLVHFQHTHTLNESEAPLFLSAVRMMAEVLCPYLTACFGRIFPGGAARVELSNVQSILKQALQEA